MKRNLILALALLTILLLRFAGLFPFWVKEGVAEVCFQKELRTFPSFSVENLRNRVSVSSLQTDLLRRERGREEYIAQDELPPPVKKYLRVFTTSGQHEFRKGLRAADDHSVRLGPVLQKYGLPSEMLFLAYIESGFRVDARSRADAVGPWQFMESTARRYGLRVDEHIDEREDLLKSTHAAGRYLRDLCREFDSLELALAAYNTGESRVRSAVRRGGTSDFWHLASQGYFSRQTINHVAKFSAAMILTSRPTGGSAYLPL